MKYLPVLFAIIVLSLPISASALECPGAKDSSGACILSDSLTTGAPGLVDIIDRVTNWIFTFLLVIAVIFIIWAGYKYLMSEGNAEEVTKIHHMLIYAAVGIAVAILSKGVVNIVKVITGGAGSSSSATPPAATPPAGTPPAATPPVATPPATPAEVPVIGGTKVPVTGIIIGGSAATVTVEQCLDGKTPGVQINGTNHGHNPAITSATDPKVGQYVALGTATGVPKSQRCIDGYVPDVEINGHLYVAPETAAARKVVADAWKAEHQAAADADYELNGSPEVLVPFCENDDTVASVRFRGVSYDAPDGMQAASTQSVKYVNEKKPELSEEAFVGNCSDGTNPSPVWLGLIRYVPQ